MGMMESAMQLSEKSKTNFEKAGNSIFCPSNIDLNFGTMTNIRKVRMPTAITMMIMG